MGSVRPSWVEGFHGPVTSLILERYWYMVVIIYNYLVYSSKSYVHDAFEVASNLCDILFAFRHFTILLVLCLLGNLFIEGLDGYWVFDMNFLRLRSLSLVLLFEAVFVYSYFRICIHVCIHTGAGRGHWWVRRAVGKGWRGEVKMKWNEGGRVY